MIWAFVVMSVLAVAGIAYGVLVDRKKREKLGLPQIRRWQKGWVPLTLVMGDGFLPDKVAALNDATKAAARFWNEQTGVKLFAALGEIADGGHVVPIMAEPIEETGHEDAVAYTALKFDQEGAIHSAAIYMVNWENLPSLILARAMKHELGHCLGLDHDEIEYSVMYGKVSERFYCVSAADKEFLKEVYG